MADANVHVKGEEDPFRTMVFPAGAPYFLLEEGGYVLRGRVIGDRNSGMMVTILILAAGVSAWLMWALPRRMTAHADLDDKEKLTLENEIRKTIAQVAGGLAVIGGLVFTWQSVAATKETLELTGRNRRTPGSPAQSAR